MLSVPLFIENEPVGVINVYSRNQKTFTADENELLRTFANNTATVIKNYQLYERIKNDKDNLVMRDVVSFGCVFMCAFYAFEPL
mgnify:CR=1 FL=1